jgi:hypothetical protein
VARGETSKGYIESSPLLGRRSELHRPQSCSSMSGVVHARTRRLMLSCVAQSAAVPPPSNRVDSETRLINRMSFWSSEERTERRNANARPANNNHHILTAVLIGIFVDGSK